MGRERYTMDPDIDERMEMLNHLAMDFEMESEAIDEEERQYQVAFVKEASIAISLDTPTVPHFILSQGEQQ